MGPSDCSLYVIFREVAVWVQSPPSPSRLDSNSSALLLSLSPLTPTFPPLWPFLWTYTNSFDATRIHINNQQTWSWGSLCAERRQRTVKPPSGFPLRFQTYPQQDSQPATGQKASTSRPSRRRCTSTYQVLIVLLAPSTTTFLLTNTVKA